MRYSCQSYLDEANHFGFAQERNWYFFPFNLIFDSFFYWFWVVNIGIPVKTILILLEFIVCFKSNAKATWSILKYKLLTRKVNYLLFTSVKHIGQNSSFNVFLLFETCLYDKCLSRSTLSMGCEMIDIKVKLFTAAIFYILLNN